MARFYKVRWDEKWVYPKMQGYKMGCCDCGLVHTVNFEVIKDWEGPEIEESKVEVVSEGYLVRINVERDNRSTAAMRREDNKKGGKDYARELVAIRDKLVKANPDLSWQEITNKIIEVLRDG